MPELKIKFDRHGLGDCIHFAHAVQLYKSRGYDVTMQVEKNKRFIWEVAGVKIAQGNNFPDHSYHYPHGFDDLSLEDCETNKVAFGLQNEVMPKLADLGATRQELWDELCNARLSAIPFLSKAAIDEAEKFLEGMPRPIICFHSRGTNWHERKSIPTEVAFETILQLLSKTGGSVIVLDYDHRAPMVGHARCKGIIPSWGMIGVDRLCALLERTDLLIGIDSGPFHVASLAGTKSLGVFRSLHPNRVCLPSPNALYLVSDRHEAHFEHRRDRWNVASYTDGEPTATDIAEAAIQLLNGTPAIDLSQPAEDVTGRYLYRRVNYDERPMLFLEHGQIGEGAAGAERRWSYLHGGIVLHGDHGAIAKLTKDDRGIFVGRWLQFEAMEVELVPTWKAMSRNNGFSWHVDPTIDRCDADLTDHEDWIYEFLTVPNGGLFVDVGAFVGQHAIRVAKSQSCRAIAIEPVPKHCDIIRRNAAINDVVSQIDIKMECAGKSSSQVHMRDDGMSSRVEVGGSVSSTMRTLADILVNEEKIDVIKIDVEGMEADVLDGLTPKANAVDRIIVEVHRYLSLVIESKVKSWAEDNGFTSQIIMEDKKKRFCYVLLSRNKET